MGMAGAAGVPPMGMAGAMGQAGMKGFQGMPAQPAGAKPIYMTFCIEVPMTIKRDTALSLDLNPSVPLTLPHPWGGRVHLLRSSGPIVKAWFYRDKDIKLVPRTATRFEQKKKSEMGKSAADRNTTHTLMLAEWALTHGLHTKFEEIMDELAKDEKNNPIVLTYQKVKGELARKIDQLPVRLLVRSRPPGGEIRFPAG